MSRQGVWVLRTLLCVGIVAVLITVRYYGIGRWWSKASARDIRSSILSHLNSLPEYRRFAADLRRPETTSFAVDVWLPVRRLRVKTAATPLESDDVDLSDEVLQNTVSRITHAQGTVADGRYHVTIIVLRAYRTPLFHASVRLADCIGEAALTIRSGKVQACSIELRDLKQLSTLNGRFVDILAALRDPVLPLQYRGASLQLLDSRACDFRTAQHIERLYSSVAQWPNFLTEKLMHVGFITAPRDSQIYYSPDYFAVASADLLGTPKAYSWSERVCRVCVLATVKNAFGETIESEQTILAFEQTDGIEISAREVRRVAAIDFNADLINGLLTGRISNPLLNYVLITVFVVVLAVAPAVCFVDLCAAKNLVHESVNKYLRSIELE